MHMCVCLYVHAFGLCSDQTPTVPPQPLRTAGDVQRTKDSMKGERKKGGEEEGQRGVHFATVRLHYFVKLHFLTRSCLRDDYRDADINPADSDYSI